MFDISPNQKIFDGVSAVSSPGHTPGHMSFLFESDNQKVLICGDIIHIPELQFTHPNINLTYDSNNKKASQSRKNLLSQSAQESLIIAGVHLPPPGLGTITKLANESYQWNPL